MTHCCCPLVNDNKTVDRARPLRRLEKIRRWTPYQTTLTLQCHRHQWCQLELMLLMTATITSACKCPNSNCCQTLFARTWLGLCYVRVFAIADLSVCLLSVTLVHPTQGVEPSGNNFFTAVYLGHPLTSVQNFTQIVAGKPLRRER